ncbi:WD40-repeat-containing domain protein [Radiomyces spectabilis]|uniref:WD40-repeat-containing domain protein n=1 Tax=Radiomyces spectabilis TaxID=64574 RepID=UPI00221FB2E2|nr:WD40-repeat-containing domain protein [Radiomyces spectabilis]KAI8364772.1 WD40-repeat-containing domain protein [Radiomyces spectabilis]
MLSILVSGEAPEEPVVSLKSGNVFEKRLIHKYIADHGKDPITNEEMTTEDLIEVKTSPATVKPRPPKLSSVPSLLSTLQNEWDSVMLESFTLKQEYQQVRQELSHALYQNDAAARVIARLKKERDTARDALANVQAHLGTAAPAAAAPAETEQTMEVDAGGLPEEVLAKITETGEALSQGRRKRKPPAEHTSADTVKTFVQTSTIPSMHSSRTPGITAVDVDKTGKLILTGGNDKHVQVYDKEEDKVVANLTGHTKKITSVKFRGQDTENDIILSASADKHVRVWAAGGAKGYHMAHNITSHKGEVTGLAVHPSKDYFVSASLETKWALHDFETGKSIVEAYDPDSQSGYTTVEFHPDGNILGTGTGDSVIRIWDVKSQRVAASFGDHTGKINALTFSENGYILATASEDNLIKIWDLRKLSNTKTFTLDEGYKVHSLAFDEYGQYLAIGGTDVTILKAKDGSPLASFSDNAAEITGLKWGPLANNLLAAGMDRTVRYYGAP